MRLLKKIAYYGDLRLSWIILIGSLKIYLNYASGSKQPLIELINRETPPRKKYDSQRITRNVRLWLKLGRKLGLKNTCLTYSLLLCRTLRTFGHEAKVNFAGKHQGSTGPNAWPIAGHCWVNLGEKEAGRQWQVIFQYP